MDKALEGIVTGYDDEKPSKNGGVYQYVFFRLEDNSSARTHIVKGFRNYARWLPIMQAFKNNPQKEVVVKGLVLKSKGTINADSMVAIKEIRG